MFHKENSSTSDFGGKKAKDVAMRKSDRVALLQTVSMTLLPTTENDMCDSESTVAMKNRLEDIFIRGSLVKRVLKMTTAAVSLYFRSPNDNHLRQNTSDGNLNKTKNSTLLATKSTSLDVQSTMIRTEWPYTVCHQCVWLSVEVRGQYGVSEFPGLALLSVLVQHLVVTDPVSPPIWVQLGCVQVLPHVSKFLCRGANLMRPGITSLSMPVAFANNSTSTKPTAHASRILQLLDSHVVVVVCVIGNPQPFGVGILHSDFCQTAPKQVTNPNFGVGTQGTGVTMIHTYGDDLWRHQLPPKTIHSRRTSDVSPTSGSSEINPCGGACFDDGHYGNVGFEKGQIVSSIISTEFLHDPNEPRNVTEDGARIPDEKVAIAEDQVDTDYSSIQAFPIDVSNESDVVECTCKPNVDPVHTDDQPNSEQIRCQETSTPTDAPDKRSPDDILHDAVCTALASMNLKRDLPMTMAIFYAQHVLPNRSADIQLKATRYKKFSSYVAEQVQLGLIATGPDPKSKDAMGLLTSYDRRHPDLVAFIAAKKVGESNEATNGVGGVDRANRRFVLADLYCVPHHFVDLLRLDRDSIKAVGATSEERQGTGMLTIKEVRAILEEYISREGLVNSDRPDEVQLDGSLTDALFKKKQATQTNDVAIPTTLLRKDIMTKWVDCQEAAYALVQLPGNKIIKLSRGKPPVISIEVSRRRGNKFVTVVLGLEAYGVDAAAFAKDASNRFACASSTTPPSTFSGSTEVLLQGNLAGELEALLLSDESLSAHGGAKDSNYNLPKNSINVVLRKGVPARKKGDLGKGKK